MAEQQGCCGENLRPAGKTTLPKLFQPTLGSARVTGETTFGIPTFSFGGIIAHFRKFLAQVYLFVKRERWPPSPKKMADHVSLGMNSTRDDWYYCTLKIVCRVNGRERTLWEWFLYIFFFRFFFYTLVGNSTFKIKRSFRAIERKIGSRRLLSWVLWLICWMIDFLVIILSEEIFEKIFKSSEEEISANEFQWFYTEMCIRAFYYIALWRTVEFNFKNFSYV